jgi:hypothetical protein
VAAVVCSGQVSVNDFIVRAVALALVDVPRANSQWDASQGEIVPCPSVDISIAVATDKGLITPIVKEADKKSLTQISAEVRAMLIQSCCMQTLTLLMSAVISDECCCMRGCLFIWASKDGRAYGEREGERFKLGLRQALSCMIGAGVGWQGAGK